VRACVCVRASVRHACRGTCAPRLHRHGRALGADVGAHVLLVLRVQWGAGRVQGVVADAPCRRVRGTMERGGASCRRLGRHDARARRCEWSRHAYPGRRCWYSRWCPRSCRGRQQEAYQEECVLPRAPAPALRTPMCTQTHARPRALNDQVVVRWQVARVARARWVAVCCRMSPPGCSGTSACACACACLGGIGTGTDPNHGAADQPQRTQVSYNRHWPGRERYARLVPAVHSPTLCGRS
jgi:hypothetical protein